MKFTIKTLNAGRRGSATDKPFNRVKGHGKASPYVRVVLAMLTLVVPLQAAAQVLSLDSILYLVDRRNPSLQAYDSRTKALDSYVAGAKSWAPPMIGAGRWMTPYSGGPETEAAARGSWMLSVEQEIPNPAKLNANKRYLESKADIEHLTRQVQLNALRAEAKTSYYGWLVAEEKMNVLEAQERILNLMLKLARIRYPYNQGSLGNIYRAEARLQEVRNTMLATQADIAQAAQRLKALAAIPATDPIMIDTMTRVSFDGLQARYDTAQLAHARSDVRKIDETIESMLLNQQLQKLKARPDFKLRFDHMQAQAGMPSQFTAMFMVSIPIAPWSNKQYKAEVKAIDYELEGLRKSRDAILIQTRGVLAGMESKRDLMRKQLNNYDSKIIPALRKNYETLMLAYEENREQLPAVLDGWEALNAAQMDYLNKLEEYYLTIVSYETELER